MLSFLEDDGQVEGWVSFRCREKQAIPTRETERRETNANPTVFGNEMDKIDFSRWRWIMDGPLNACNKSCRSGLQLSSLTPRPLPKCLVL